MPDFRNTILADLYRENGRASRFEFIRMYLTNPVFRHLVRFRSLQRIRGMGVLKPLFYLLLFLHERSMIRLGIRLPLSARIGRGLYIPHFGGIWINPDAEIGVNCNLSQGVTLGGLTKGPNQGAPKIGDRVYIGPNATIVGGVTIGDDALIGANSLIVTNVPPKGVAIGVPARIFSTDGSFDLINQIDYPESFA